MKQSTHSIKKKFGSELGPHHTLIIPFSPEMNNPKLLFKILESAGEKAEIEINLKYSKEQAFSLIKMIRVVLNEVKSIPNQKTLAIFISGFAKNVYFFTPTKTLPLPSVMVSGPNKG